MKLIKILKDQAIDGFMLSMVRDKATQIFLNIFLKQGQEL